MLDYSIITPVYNGQEFIENTILSVLNSADNSKLNYEYIVVDDGSTDNTEKILSSYQDRIRYVYQENMGQALAINHGLKLASGKYCTIINADDPIVSSDLFLMSKIALDKNTNLVGTYPDWYIIDSVGKVKNTVRVRDYSLVEMVGNFNCLVGPGGVFRTTAGQKIGGWNSHFKFVPDYDFWLRLLRYGEYLHLPIVLANWRTHEKSISISSRGSLMAKERIKVIEDYLIQNPQTPEKIKKSAKANSIYRAAVLCYFDPTIDGKRLLFQALKANLFVVLRKNLAVNLYLLFMPVSGLALKKIKKIGFLEKYIEIVQRNLRW